MSHSEEYVTDSLFLAQKPFRFFQRMHRYHDIPPPHQTYWEEDILMYGSYRLAAQIKTAVNLAIRLPFTASDKASLMLLETGLKGEVEFLLSMIGAAFCNGHTPIMCSPLKILVLEYFSPEKWGTHNLHEDAQHWMNMIENLAPWLPADVLFANDWWNHLDGGMPPTGILDLTNVGECLQAFREFIPAAYAHARFYDQAWSDMPQPVIPKRQQEPSEKEKVPLFLYEMLALHWEDDYDVQRGSATEEDIEYYIDNWGLRVEEKYGAAADEMMESVSAADLDVDHNNLLALLNNAPRALPSPDDEDALLQVLKAAPPHLPPTQDDQGLLEFLKTAPPELPQVEVDDIMHVLENAPMELVGEDTTDEFATTAELHDLMDILGKAPPEVLPSSEYQSPDPNVGFTAEQDLLHLLATAPSQLSEPPHDTGLSPLGGTESGDLDIFSILCKAPPQLPFSPDALSSAQPSNIDNGLWTMRGETRGGDVMHSNGGSSGYVSDRASSDDSENDVNDDSDPADLEVATSDEADEDNEESEDNNEEDEDNEDEDDNDDEEEVVSGLLRRGSSSSVGGTQYGSDDQLYVSSN
ncbi:hypothetical protein BJ165DRAFT_1535319 [Panaeolus papilionaceus]|nr:hypothetical protein BJ165DRAFT_1535319 [Panaeolus papilionaceus]